MEPAFPRVTVADKLDNVRSILADYARVGDKLWEQFSTGREDQLWYYESARLMRLQVSAVPRWMN